MKNVAIVFLFALLACPIMSYGQTPPASPSPQSPALVEKSRDSYEGRVWRLDATDVTALPRNFRTTDMLFRPVEKNTGRKSILPIFRPGGDYPDCTLPDRHNSRKNSCRHWRAY